MSRIMRLKSFNIFNIQAVGLSSLHPRPEGRGFTADRINSCHDYIHYINASQ